MIGRPETKTPPPSAQRIWRVADLPKHRDPAWYGIRTGDEPERAYLLCKRQRQIMDLLIAGPVYCASPVRISDVVHILKRETGLAVETEFYPGDSETGAGTYGVYFLTSRVRRLAAQEVAA